MKPTPILFLSDNPALPTGLGRITKDLAVHVASLPEFRVGTMGLGYPSSAKLPFFQATFPPVEQWGEGLIEGIWSNFAGSDPGIIMTIWDASRLDWFSQPRMGGQLESFLRSGRFKRWGYFPIDSYGYDDRLTGMCVDTVQGFDRVLAYTIFGKKVLQRSLGREVDWIPHGIDGDIFKPRERGPGRSLLGVPEDDLLVGCVMTNQARKDWGVAFAAIAAIKRPNRKFWFHTDATIRYWNLFALAADFGVEHNVIITTKQFSSDELSHLYSACDMTFLPSPEGFGYPIVESLACGVPVVHGAYAGGAELVPEKDWLVNPVAERMDTQWNCLRPVWNPQHWAKQIDWCLTQHSDGTFRDTCTRAVEHLHWKNLWPSCWKKWFLEGIGES